MAFCNLIGYMNPDNAEQKVIPNQTRLLLEEGECIINFKHDNVLSGEYLGIIEAFTSALHV